jgi:hypothetical protein
MSVMAEIQCVFPDKRYIASGTHDIGLARLEIQDLNKNSLQLVDVTVSEKTVLGHVVTGVARVLVRGTVVYNEEVSSPRVLIAAISAPGCIGCPLFDSQQRLVALVHGNSKHRHGNSIEDASSSVYGDACCFDSFEFKKVKPHFTNCLKDTENWSEEDARNSSVCLDSDDCPHHTKEFWAEYASALNLLDSDKGQSSWDTTMTRLSQKALDDDDPVSLGYTLPCLAPVINVPADSEMTPQLGVVTPNKA